MHLRPDTNETGTNDLQRRVYKTQLEYWEWHLLILMDSSIDEKNVQNLR